MNANQEEEIARANAMNIADEIYSYYRSVSVSDRQHINKSFIFQNFNLSNKNSEMVFKLCEKKGIKFSKTPVVKNATKSLNEKVLDEALQKVFEKIGKKVPNKKIFLSPVVNDYYSNTVVKEHQSPFPEPVFNKFGNSEPDIQEENFYKQNVIKKKTFL